MSLQLSISARLGAFDLTIDTDLPGSGLTAIFGPSGCGKTTLLRCIAGLTPSQGTIKLGKTCWQNTHSNINLLSHHRNLAYIFQDARLLPHLTVLENIQFNRALRGLSEKGPELEQAIEEFQLQSMLNRRPHQLSGGQRQRVGLARALASAPDLILMDEPLSALDDASKEKVMRHIKRFKNNTETPILYVSHSIEEIAQLAEHLVMMDNGQKLASGNAHQLFSDRPDLFQESQLASLIKARVVSIDDKLRLAQAEIQNNQGDSHRLWLSSGELNVGQDIRLRIAARDVSLSLIHNTQQSILNSLPATVDRLQAGKSPGTVVVTLNVGNQSMHAQITQKSCTTLGIKIGMSIWAQVKALSVLD